jgi:hypothetical protein
MDARAHLDIDVVASDPPIMTLVKMTKRLLKNDK